MIRSHISHSNMAFTRSRRPISLKLSFVLYTTILIFFLANAAISTISEPSYYLKWICLILVFLMFFRSLMKRVGRRRVRWAALIGFFLLTPIAASVPGSIDLDQSLLIVTSIVFSVFSGLAVATRLDTLDARRKFFAIAGSVGRLLVASSWLMLIAGISLGHGGERFTAWVGNPNALAMMLAPMLIIFLARSVEQSRGWLFKDALFLVAGLVVILHTGSRAGMLWFTVSAFSLLVIYRASSIWIYLLFLASIIIIAWWSEIYPYLSLLLRRENTAYDADVSSGRTELWAIGMMLIENKPFLGYGIGVSGGPMNLFSYYFHEYPGGHFHNSYITIAVEAGLVSLLAFLIIMAYVILLGFRSAIVFRKRFPNDWATAALPWSLVVGASAHGLFETWLLSAGNALSLVFWVSVWMTFLGLRKIRPGKQQEICRPNVSRHVAPDLRAR